jgi:hypothetical protein
LNLNKKESPLKSNLFIFCAFTVSVVLAATFLNSKAVSQQNLISPFEGRPESARHDTDRRIYRLELAVRELQNKVYALSESAPAVKNKYFCKIDIFGKVYKAFGPSRLEAEEKAKDDCNMGQSNGGGSSIHCTRATCEEVK